MKRIISIICLLIVVIQLQGQTQECYCLRGIGSREGDKPIVTYSFTGGNSISFCGYLNSIQSDSVFVISEFDIQNCTTQDFLARYGAVSTCLVEMINDTIMVTEQVFTPTIGDSSFVPKDFKQRVIFEKQGIVYQGIKAVYKKENLTPAQIEVSLNSLESFKGTQDYKDLSYLIGMLEYLSLNGVEEAYQLLKNMEEHYQVNTNAATTEHWHEALASIKWFNAATQ